MPFRGRVQEEGGFSLIELTVAVAVLGLLTTGLAAALGVTLQASTDATDRASGAATTRSLAVYLPPDIEGATAATASSTGAGITCTGVANPRLELRGAAGYVVVYGVRNISGDDVLERSDCSTGAEGETIVVARHLAGSTAVVPAVTLSGGAFAGASLQVTTAVRAGAVAPVAFVSASRRVS